MVAMGVLAGSQGRAKSGRAIDESRLGRHRRAEQVGI
jgi:hypothetical protein